MKVSKILEVENLSVSFNSHEIIKGLSFSVAKGDVLAVVGPNGAGKSVMFRALLGLIPFFGSVRWATGLKISYIPQKLSIDRFIPLSVREFMAFKEPNPDHILRVLRLVGLGQMKDEHHLEHHILDQRIGSLSGGQLQRVLVAWSIIDNPDILLYDEPTSGIDVGGEETIYNLLKKLQDEQHLTVLLISHDLNVVYKYATNVVCMNRSMLCFGVPHEVLDPAALAQLYGGHASFFQHEHSS